MAVIIDQLVNKLKDAAYDEVKFQLGINDTVEEITNRLKAFQGLVQYASERKQDNSLAEERVKQLRETAIFIEDVLEEFMLEMELLEINKPSNFCEVKNIGAIMLYHIKKAYGQFRFHHQLNVIKKKLEFQEGEQDKYRSLTVSQEVKSLPVGRSYYVEGLDIVGRDKEVAELRDLVEQPRDHMLVITVWGPGGSGKTTLAKNVCKSVELNNDIDCWAWVYVKQSPNIKKVLRSMLTGLFKSMKEEAPDGLDKKEEHELQELIRDFLKQKRYVLILDDVWDTDILNQIEVPAAKMSSVIVTSRQKSIAQRCAFLLGVQRKFLEVKPLNPDPSWDLFCEVAFSNSIPRGRSCPDHLISRGRELVGKCGGLPLAILVIAQLMATKGDNAREWDKIIQSLDSQLHGELVELNRALLLSYYHLPPHLKPCFLYCAMFHKSDHISVRKLIRLWIAEGFVNKADGSSTVEDIARGYFNELIQRSMLQFGYESRGFQMHDLLRDVAVQMIAQENFGVLLKQEMIELDSNQRRLVISHMKEPKLRLGTCKLKLRTLIARRSEQFYSSLPEMLQNIKLIRTLELEDALHIENVPDELGDLIHLTYLSLSGTWISDLPDSIKKLCHLQTLDVRNTVMMEHVPRGIAELKQLRHLLMEQTGMLSGDCLIMPDITFKFAQLQTLSGVHLNLNQAMELKSTTQLTKLNISAIGEESWREIYDAIRMMRNLRTLILKAGIGSPEVGSSEVGSPEVLQVGNLPVPPCLEKLTLFSFNRLPNSIVSHGCLREITLSNGYLFEDGFITLGQLPSLKVLKLKSTYQGEQLICEPDSFPKLEEFEISYTNYLTTWNQIPKGSMKYLRELSIRNCDKLQMLPDGLQELKNLQMLNLLYMPKEFLQRIDIGGPDYSKIQCIPRIQQSTPRDLSNFFVSLEVGAD